MRHFEHALLSLVLKKRSRTVDNKIKKTIHTQTHTQCQTQAKQIQSKPIQVAQQGSGRSWFNSNLAGPSIPLAGPQGLKLEARSADSRGEKSRFLYTLYGLLPLVSFQFLKNDVFFTCVKSFGPGLGGPQELGPGSLNCLNPRFLRHWPTRKCNNCSRVYVTQHRTVLIIFPLNLLIAQAQKLFYWHENLVIYTLLLSKSAYLKI